jgi:DDE superfamily endonuclease
LAFVAGADPPAERIDREVPADLAVHVVLDNCGTRETPIIRRWLLRHPRFQLHFTSTSSSWINPVERWFAGPTEKQLRHGAHRRIRELMQEIRIYLATSNEDPKCFAWVKTADEILASVGRFCERTPVRGR